MTESESNGFYAPQMRKVPTGELVRPSKKTNGVGVQAEDTRICVVMVGLPARGKSLIAQKGKIMSPRFFAAANAANASCPLPALALDQVKNVQRWPVPPHSDPEPLGRVLRHIESRGRAPPKSSG
jgi:hypothetical protein